MRSSMIFIIAILSLFLSYSQLNKKEEKNIDTYNTANNYFNAAIKISNTVDYDEAKEIALNEKALDIFSKLNLKLIKGKEDSLAFFCHLKTAILYHYFDSTNLAKAEYFKSLAFKNNSIADSFSFQPLVFIGRIYYGQNKFDSAYLYYKKAETISDIYDKKLDEEERLYNGLGSMLYEIGNYKQAKNYYEKAIALLDVKNNTNNDFLIKYKSNIASCLIKLEEYNTADSIYKSLLQFKINENEIYQNLGSIQLQQGNAKEALNYFTKINNENAQTVSLNNKIGKSYLLLNKLDSAEKYFNKSVEENIKWNSTRKNNAHGITFQYMAEKDVVEKNYNEAIDNYQQAIQQFYPDYNEKDIYKNPEKFSGIFSYINLFNTLAAKADAFENFYTIDKKTNYLDAAIQAYRSAFLLADYVGKTYESDEARMFLNKIKYKVHDKPIHLCIQLYELTKKKMYLEDAYLFDQQNKASVLSLNLQEAALKSQFTNNVELLNTETNLKTNITRLSLKAAQVSDSSLLQKLKIDIRENEIELAKLQGKINNILGYREKKMMNTIPSVLELQNVIPKNTAVLSYHLAEKEMVILSIAKNELGYAKVNIDSTFYNKLEC
jgi:tetratricopeptide (TPR) repeat protein